MTIGIAAASHAGRFIVAVTDQRLSHGDVLPASDAAILKASRLGSKWGLMFAATDACAFEPVVNHTRDLLNYREEDDGVEHTFPEVVQAVTSAYQLEIEKQFYNRHLARLGYSSITEFRKDGFSELGSEKFYEYADALRDFDLGLELLVYGINMEFYHLFEVTNPGIVREHTRRGYAAIGSGSIMAHGALVRKRLSQDLHNVVYRLLDAKFSSETARGVGRATIVITMNHNGETAILGPEEVDEIRAIWEREVSRPEPPDAEARIGVMLSENAPASSTEVVS